MGSTRWQHAGLLLISYDLVQDQELATEGGGNRHFFSRRPPGRMAGHARPTSYKGKPIEVT
jgi:hypothetical protein